VKSVLAMRACCVLEQDQPTLQQFSKAAFDAYFGRGENVDEPDVIQAIADDCGLDGASLVSDTAEQSIKDQLRSSTEEATERGAYGSPTMFIDDALYFGNDQLPLVRAALLSESS
jgi:2-hydroxychromene-2-carboxylate isomerase